jgi:hypothetical protein
MKSIAAHSMIRLIPMMLWLTGGAAWAATEGTSGTFFGTGAGAAAVSTSGDNTFIGVNAGHNTTSVGNGFNTFVGWGSGFTNTTGSFDSFFGLDAGFHNTIGMQNSFFGETAGEANTSGNENSFFGYSAGSDNTTGSGNTFVGSSAGQSSSGSYNTFLGRGAGNFGAGDGNAYVGAGAGINSSGSYNVFLGYLAGSQETSASHRLYIDNCLGLGPCTAPPLVYGEFDNHLLKFNGVTHVAANGAAKSQMHFSLDNGDYGGFLTSVLPNNFFVSSGARFDSPNWVQLSADGNAVMAGSGGQGYRIFTHTGASVGSTFTNLALRLQIDYSGQFGINTTPVAGDEIHTSSGAHLTSGGVWTDASSREYKEHIRPLTTEEALRAFAGLEPVRYNYKADAQEEHVGFIAEDVPSLVANRDRKSLSPMDIVAVLTKVVREQAQDLRDKTESMARQQKTLEDFESKLAALEAEVQRLTLQRR